MKYDGAYSIRYNKDIKGIDSGKLHSDDNTEISLSGIIALCLVAFVILLVVAIGVVSFIKNNIRNRTQNF